MEEYSTISIDMEDKSFLIDEIMKAHGQEILQLVYSYVNNKAVAEDLTQEIFIKCYKALHTYNKKSKLRTWLWRIAINHCKDYLRSWYNNKVILGDEEAEHNGTPRESIERTVIQKDEDERLASEVMQLPVIYREVIYMFYFEEMSLKEIADVTMVKENTVKTRLRRGRELLKIRLEGLNHG